VLPVGFLFEWFVPLPGTLLFSAESKPVARLLYRLRAAVPFPERIWVVVPSVDINGAKQFFLKPFTPLLGVPWLGFF